MEDKKYSGEIRVNSSFLAKIDNFWYHYKWVTIGVAFVLITLLICTLQMCSKEKEDILITYAGPEVIEAESYDTISKILGFVLPEDFDGDGKKNAGLNTYSILSKEQIEEIEAKTDSAGNREYVVNRGANSEEYNNYQKYLLTGESSVFFVDPWLYEEMKSADRLVAISDVSGKEISGNIDGYGVKLGDTALYDKYDALKELPEDTVICLMKQYVVGKSSDAKAYEFEKDVFRTIVEYGS